MALPTYSTGTASVAAGGTVVTGVGGMWSGINVKQGDFISIGGSDAALITEVTDSTHLKVAPWSAGAKTGQPYIIYQNYVGRLVGVAAAEDVGDMLEMLHVDGLPFIVGVDETVPDPSYGDDGQMAFQPSTGQWWTKTGGAWVSSPGLTSDASKVLKAGDTMTGYLVISNADPVLVLDKTSGAGGHASNIIGRTAGATRWTIQPGDGAAETGGDAGSNFCIYNYDDAGVNIGTPLTIQRETGTLALTPYADFVFALQLKHTSGLSKNFRVSSDNKLELVDHGNTQVIASISDVGELFWLGTPWTAYTPTVFGGGAGTAFGRYKKHGKTVHLAVIVTITTTGANMSVTAPPGLPASGSGFRYFISGRENAATGMLFYGMAQPSSLDIYIARSDGVSTLNAGWVIYMSGSYETV